MKLTAVIEPTNTGFSGYLIEFGGRIIAAGDTADEVATFLREAAEDMLEDARARGQALNLSPVIVQRLDVA